MKKFDTGLMLFSACFVLFLTATAFAAVGTDQILDGAVTNPKIADGAVTDAKISGTISGSKLGVHTHSGADISDGTITDTKISGPISASKISSTGLDADTVDGKHASDLAEAVHTHSQSQVTGLEAALAVKSDVNHNHDALYQQKYGKVAVVAQTGGDYNDPVAAMSNVATWCGTPSASNPCLVKIMPGIYDIGGNVLSARDYVDIDGSGKNNTVITASIAVPAYIVNEYITHTGLSNLTIKNTAGTAIRIFLSSPEIRNVYVSGWGQDAIISDSANALLDDVTIDTPNAEAWTFGIHTMGGGGTFKNIKILNADEAIYNYTGTISIKNMETSAEIMNQGNMTIENSKVGNVRVVLYSSDMATNLVNTQVQGTITRDREMPVILRCVNVYDGNFTSVTCPSW